MWSRLFAPAAIAGLAGAIACGDGSGPGDSDCLEDPNSISASVSSGTTPTLSWSPQCTMAVVLVEELDGGDVWALGVPDSLRSTPLSANRILPPLTYGVKPSGVTGVEADVAEPLVSGNRYILLLWRKLSGRKSPPCVLRLDDYCLYAAHQFTP